MNRLLIKVAVAAIVCHRAAEWQGVSHTGNLHLHLLPCYHILGEVFFESLLHNGEHSLCGVRFFCLEFAWCKVILCRESLVNSIRYIHIIVEDVLTRCICAVYHLGVYINLGMVGDDVLLLGVLQDLVLDFLQLQLFHLGALQLLEWNEVIV